MPNLPDGCTVAMIERAAGTNRFAYFERWLDDAREHYHAIDGAPGDDDWMCDGNDRAWEAFADGVGPDDYARQINDDRLEIE
jgi:hypothetical protein